MPTSAEADRIAQEDAMMRQIAMQQAAQRQANAVRKDMLGARAGAEDAQVRAAEIQAKAQLEAARIAAGAQTTMSKDIGDRQERVARVGLEMSDAQKADLDLRRSDPRVALGEVISASLRGDAGMDRGGAKVAPARSQAATDVTKGTASRPAYDMTGFNADVAGIAANAAAARGTSNAMGPDDLPAADIWAKGASIRDPSGQLRTVAFPGVSSSSTPDRATMARQVTAQMMPTPPAGFTPAPQPPATTLPPYALGYPGAATTATTAAAPAPKPAATKKTLAERYLDKELGMPADEQEAVDLKKRTIAAAETGDMDAQAMADQQGWQYVKRKVKAASVETDPVIQQSITALAEQAANRGDWFMFNEDKKHAKASGNADALLMQAYNQMVDLGVPKADAKKRLQAELVKLNMAHDIQWGLPEGIQKDK